MRPEVIVLIGDFNSQENSNINEFDKQLLSFELIWRLVNVKDQEYKTLRD